MGENGIGRGDADEPHLRDRLALIRTVLANERTFLAYLRSSLALIATGVTAVRFISGQAATGSGLFLVMLGFLCLAYGYMRFRTARRAIREDEHTGALYKT